MMKEMMLHPTTDMTTLPPIVELFSGVEGVRAFSTTRGCLDPAAPHDGFSVCDYVEGFDAVAVAGCRDRLAGEFGLRREALVVPRQTHSVRVAVVGADMASDGGAGPEVDALVTADPGVILCINTADCAPVLFVDPKARIAGACHSGWRGTVGNIAVATVEAMVGLGADPASVLVAFGPMICGNCFEVGREVASLFDPADVMESSSGGRPHVDLHGAICRRLLEAGILREHMASPIACPMCEPGRFFSARRLGVASGRTATAIALV